MSRIAQEMQRVADDLQKQQSKGGKKVPVEILKSKIAEVATQDQPKKQETDMAMTEKERSAAYRKRKKEAKTGKPAKAAKAKTAAKPKAAKAEKAPRQPRGAAVAIPDPTTALLAENGVRVEERNRYVNIYFADGFVLRLQPANLGQDDTLKARDFAVAFLKANLK